MFGGKPHGSLRKRLKTITAASVLELGVGDGSQAIAAMEALSNKSNSIRYFGVDEFEMAGGVNLKQFHQTLRNHGIHPQLFPGSVDRGLMKIAHTFGSVDLILVANPAVIDSNPAVTGLLARISHQETNILVLRNETWTPLQVSGAHAQRRAA
jgi:methylase of polypeptide subunit release factors